MSESPLSLGGIKPPRDVTSIKGAAGVTTGINRTKHHALGYPSAAQPGPEGCRRPRREPQHNGNNQVAAANENRNGVVSQEGVLSPNRRSCALS